MLSKMIFDVTDGRGIIILCIITIIVCGVLYISKRDDAMMYDDDIEFTIKQKISILIPAMIAIICISMYIIVIRSMIDIPYDYQEDKPANSVEYLVGLNDNMGIRGGKSYIVRGYVESNMYYNYMANCGSYMKMNQLNATTNDIRIIVSNTEVPRIEWRTKKKTYGLFYQEERYWNMYVPENAINDTISIDMK